LWEAAFTTAYDAYRTAADAVVLMFGHRIPATSGGHRIATDIAHAALQVSTVAFAPASAERFRQGRHESEHFDPDRPVEKMEADTRWAIGLFWRRNRISGYGNSTIRRVSNGDRHEWSTRHRVVKTSAAGGDPSGVTNGDLHLTSQQVRRLLGPFIQFVPVRITEHQQIDVLDRPFSVLAREAGRPGTEHERLVDAR
jgi:hypothetical protein